MLDPRRLNAKRELFYRERIGRKSAVLANHAVLEPHTYIMVVKPGHLNVNLNNARPALKRSRKQGVLPLINYSPRAGGCERVVSADARAYAVANALSHMIASFRVARAAVLLSSFSTLTLLRL